jgi:hypothetical protein
VTVVAMLAQAATSAEGVLVAADWFAERGLHGWVGDPEAHAPYGYGYGNGNGYGNGYGYGYGNGNGDGYGGI